MLGAFLKLVMPVLILFDNNLVNDMPPDDIKLTFVRSKFYHEVDRFMLAVNVFLIVRGFLFCQFYYSIGNQCHTISGYLRMLVVISDNAVCMHQ